MTIIWLILIVLAFIIGLLTGWSVLLWRLGKAGYGVEFSDRETRLYRIEKHPLKDRDQ